MNRIFHHEGHEETRRKDKIIMPELKYSYDRETDVFEIEGNKFSGTIFRMFAKEAEIGSKFKFIKRENGTIYLESLKDQKIAPAKAESAIAQRKDVMNIIELIGKRVLLKLSDTYHCEAPEECRILEVSPSGNWIKIMNLNGRKFWKAIKSVSLVEVLKDIEKAPTEKTS